MPNMFQYAGQVVVYAGLMLVIGFFADTPSYQFFKPDHALIKVAFVHSGKAKGGCRIRTAEELSKLAPNMRMKKVCPRNRLPLMLELFVDGKQIYKDVLPATGFRNTGPSMVYKSFPVSTGHHKIMVRMRDSERTEGYDYTTETEVMLKPSRHFVIQFRAERGEFTFS